MTARMTLVTLTGVAVVAGAAGCGKSGAPAPSQPPTTSASAAAPSPPAGPSTAGATPEPCDLLSPAIAKQFAGDDARQQHTLDTNPPLPVLDTACLYKGSSRSVYFSITAMTTDPTDPVNHFHVIAPQNQIPGHAYAAYWFGPGQSVYVVKDGHLLNFQVQDNVGAPNPRSVDDLKADDLRLADQIVPNVG